MSSQKNYLLKIVNYLEKFHFANICTQEMFQIMLLVFVAKRHSKQIMEASIKTHRDGLLGMVGNKGACQCTFTLYNKVFNFVSGHLRHGQNAVDARNEMMSNIMKTFRCKEEVFNGLDSDVLADYTWIFGDLNYRMNSNFQDLVPLIKDCPSLIKSLDQYTEAIKSYEEEGSAAYPDFEESEITFPPSYKKCKNKEQLAKCVGAHALLCLASESTVIHEDESVVGDLTKCQWAQDKEKEGKEKIKGPIYVDKYKNKKNQAPSYTDRVLFKNNTSFPHTVHKYDCLSDQLGSDHRPVFLDADLSVAPHLYLAEAQMTEMAKKKEQQFALLQFDKL